MNRPYLVSIILLLALTSCMSQKDQNATKTQLKRTEFVDSLRLTQEKYINSIQPRIGSWKGNYNIIFKLTNEGIRDFTITIPMQMFECRVITGISEVIKINADKTIQHKFGMQSDKEANIIRGKYSSDTTLNGTYSKIFLCNDMGHVEKVNNITETPWSAHWIN